MPCPYEWMIYLFGVAFVAAGVLHLVYNGPMRRTPRLKEYNYAQLGAYFVTICSYERECLFGKVEDANCILTPEGQIVERYLLEVPLHRLTVRLDEFIVM